MMNCGANVNTKERLSLDELPEFFSMGELSQVFRISRATAYRLTAKGYIPCLRLGKRIIFSRERLKKWAAQMMEE